LYNSLQISKLLSVDVYELHNYKFYITYVIKKQDNKNIKIEYCKNIEMIN